MLMANAKRRSAALKSSTPINGFQHRLLPLPFSEANASGMVSNLFLLHWRFHRHSFWHPRQRIVFSFRFVAFVLGVSIFRPKRFSYDRPIQ
jgi:hypothetical protein